MTVTGIFAIILTVIFLLDTFVFVPKGTKIWTKEHALNGDKTGYITQALKLDYTKIIKGQVWRLFSQVFLHVGVLHIAFNILAILIVGYALESTVGWVKTICCFFFSALFSGIIMAFGLKFDDGEGASTGIYGMIALYMVLAVKEHTVFFSNLHWIFVLVLGIYTVMGMVLSKIDRLEHFTGFAGGLLYSIVLLFLL